MACVTVKFPFSRYPATINFADPVPFCAGCGEYLGDDWKETNDPMDDYCPPCRAEIEADSD